MDWKTEVIDRLREYRCCCDGIKTCTRRLHDVCRDIEYFKQKNQDIFSGELYDLCAEKELLEANLERAQKNIRRIDEALQGLCDIERAVLTEMYIKGAQDALPKLMRQFSYERRNIYYIRDRALKHLATVYYLA